jgi:hypothetical protein
LTYQGEELPPCWCPLILKCTKWAPSRVIPRRESLPCSILASPLSGSTARWPLLECRRSGGLAPLIVASWSQRRSWVVTGTTAEISSLAGAALVFAAGSGSCSPFLALFFGGCLGLQRLFFFRLASLTFLSWMDNWVFITLLPFPLPLSLPFPNPL